MIASALVALAALAGCSSAVESDLDRQYEDSTNLVILRNCEGSVASDRGERGWGSWPDSDTCLSDNEAGIARIVGDLDAGRAVDIEFLCQYCGAGHASYYWFIEADGSGEYFYETICDVSPSSAGCGWNSDDFDSITYELGSEEIEDDEGNPITVTILTLSWSDLTIDLPLRGTRS